MPYRIIYHPAVDQDDFPPIDARLRARIFRAIEQRLTSEPAHYGEPLREALKRYWKLRVGDYRIIYRVVEQEVWIYRIGHRKNIYNIPFRRFTWQPQ